MLMFLSRLLDKNCMEEFYDYFPIIMTSCLLCFPSTKQMQNSSQEILLNLSPQKHHFFLLIRAVVALKQLGAQGLEKMWGTVVRRQRKFQILNGLKRLKWLWQFCAFSARFLNMLWIFLVCQNNFCEPFSFYKGFFS